MLVVFQKGNKVTNKAFAALVTTIKLTDETIARIEIAFVYFTNHQQKLRRFQGCYYCLVRQEENAENLHLTKESLIQSLLQCPLPMYY